MNKETRLLILIILLSPSILFAQDIEIIEGLPSNLSTSRMIFLEHEEINLETKEESEQSRKYVLLRQENHNEVLKEYNIELKEAATNYLFEYTIAQRKEVDSLKKLGYQYLLDSELFKYEHLRNQPDEDALIVFEYYLRDLSENKLYKVFELDEMKVYDAKLIVKKLNKAIANSQKSK